MNDNEFTGRSAGWIALAVIAFVAILAIAAGILFGMVAIPVVALLIVLGAVFTAWWFDPEARAEAEQTMRDMAGESAEDWREKVYGKLRRGGDA